MYVTFDSMPKHARLWIYQADRSFTNSEQDIIRKQVAAFCESWAAHSQPLTASYALLHERFLILAVDEQANKASGCSIDSSVALIKQLEQALQVNLFDRTLVAYLDKEAKLQTLKLAALPQAIDKGVITTETLVFDNLIQLKMQLENEWKVPASQTWLKRYFKSETV
ncbi:MAG: hypothetical protein JJT94_08100 [Bernardetiaceae bacterium]|nr:hypothetical protein [Bernardetiaceae bacterium]